MVFRLAQGLLNFMHCSASLSAPHAVLLDRIGPAVKGVTVFIIALNPYLFGTG